MAEKAVLCGGALRAGPLDSSTYLSTIEAGADRVEAIAVVAIPLAHDVGFMLSLSGESKPDAEVGVAAGAGRVCSTPRDWAKGVFLSAVGAGEVEFSCSSGIDLNRWHRICKFRHV